MQTVKCKMHNAGISFLFLNVDVLQKESCYITLNSISSESKQACPKSKDTLRFTCFDTRNIWNQTIWRKQKTNQLWTSNKLTLKISKTPITGLDLRGHSKTSSLFVMGNCKWCKKYKRTSTISLYNRGGMMESKVGFR